MPVSARRKMFFTSWKRIWTASAICPTNISPWTGAGNMVGRFQKVLTFSVKPITAEAKESIWTSIWNGRRATSPKRSASSPAKTLGESGADLDRMFLISSAITKAFRGDNSVHARYMVVGGQSEPAETMSLNLSPDEQRLVTQALAEQRIRLGSQAEGEEKLLRRMTGSVTEYMDAAGLADRLDEHDRDLLAQHDGEQETAPVMGGMQL